MRLSLLLATILHIVLGSSVAASGHQNFQKSAAFVSQPTGPVVVETIYHFNTSVSLTNLAVRHTGEILVTLDNYPILYSIEPKVDGIATLVHTFEGYQVLHGIVEVVQDQFYVACGNFSLVTHLEVPDSSSVFHVDMTGFPEHVEVNEVAHFPDARVLNGMGLLSEEKGLVYVADSRVGVVNILNVYTGEHFVAIDNSFTNQPPGASEVLWP